MTASSILWLLLGGAIVGVIVGAVHLWRSSRTQSASAAMLGIAAAAAKKAQAERLYQLRKADAAAKAKTKQAREEVNAHADSGSNFADDPPFGSGPRHSSR